MPDMQSKPFYLFLINLAPSFRPTKIFSFSLVTVSLTQHDSCKIPSNNKKKRKENPPSRVPSTEHSLSTWLLLLLYRVGDTVCLVPWVSLFCPQNTEQCAKSSIVLRRGPSTVVGLWGGFQKHPSFPAVGRNKEPRRCSLECGPFHPTPDPTLPLESQHPTRQLVRRPPPCHQPPSPDMAACLAATPPAGPSEETFLSEGWSCQNGF